MYCYYYDAHRAHEAAHVLDEPARAVAHEMWFTTTTLSGVPGSLSAKNSYTFIRCISSKSPRAYIILCKCRIKALVS